MKAPSSSGMHTPHVNPVCAHDPNACKFVQKAALAERNKKTSQEERIYPARRSHDGVQRACSTRDPVSAGHVVIICLSARQSCLRRTTCWQNCREIGIRATGERFCSDEGVRWWFLDVDVGSSSRCHWMPQCRSLTKTLHCRKPDETVRPAKIPKQCECITRGFLHVQANLLKTYHSFNRERSIHEDST